MTTVRSAATITSIAPQFLVDDLEKAITYYRDRLGFQLNFVYESFYASVSRDGFAIHLKCAPRVEGEREYRKSHEHLDAYLAVSGVRELFGELQSRGANVIRPLEDRPWSCTDFYVEDKDGYILCFSELTPGTKALS
jgi:uncharacterized glyoxalase superfamily protein PhnB